MSIVELIRNKKARIGVVVVVFDAGSRRRRKLRVVGSGINQYDG